MELQTVANVVQSDATRDLGKDHGDDVTPGRKAAGFFVGSSFTRQFFD